MAYLYETATWRAIVESTRDPKKLMLFTIATVGGAYFIAKTSQVATDMSAEQTKQQMEDRVEKDWETKSYARHSKSALAVMFDNVRKDNQPDLNEKHKAYPVKLPGVMWHPKIAEKERKRAQLLDQTQQPESTTEPQ